MTPQPYRDTDNLPPDSPATTPRSCPVDHHAGPMRKTGRFGDRLSPPVSRDAAGVWHIRGYAAARSILRDAPTRQAGFKAELLEQMPGSMRPPVLYQEGKFHQQQRQQTARFFTPRAVSTKYRQLMERYADDLIHAFRSKGRADLSMLSMQLAVRVAGEVVGLTESRLPGMDRRINAFFGDDIAAPGWKLRQIVGALRNQVRVAAFYYLDVAPAIRARRRQPREDVISHLIEQGYNGGEILTECITYGAAGMVTTREFISMAAWHMLEDAALRERYLGASEDMRQVILQELLRVEPVVGHLLRRATADWHVDETHTVRAGDLIDLHLYAANADSVVVGEEPQRVCPGRALHAERATPAMLSFGDGHHRCPGAYIALQEADIFLHRLLSLPSLRMERPPTLTWNELVTGYELRHFIVRVD